MRSTTLSLLCRALFLSAFLSCVCAIHAAAKLEASLDRTTIAANESATLQLSFINIVPGSAPGIPPITGLNIRYSSFVQRIVSDLGGQRQNAMIYQYIVTPSAAGEYVIPAMQAVVQGVTLKTEALTLRVVPAQQASTNQPQYAFLRLITPPRDVYVGEVFTVEVQLYYVAGRGQDISYPQFKGEGFTINKRQDPPPQSNTHIGNIRYQTVTFRYSVSAAKAGDLTFGPATVNMNLRVPVTTRTPRRDPFDVFADIDDIFGRFDVRPVELASEPTRINVLPLPKGAPASFAGAIGKFTMSVTATPTNVTAGDPITLKAVVRGTGGLDALNLPPFKWNDFQVYPANSSVETTDPLGLQGTKTFEMAIAPQNASVRAIPEIKFSYFDPETKKYETLTEPAIPLSVAPGANQPAQNISGAVKNDEPAERQELYHIKVRPGAFVSVAASPLVPPWVWAAYALPPLMFLGAFTWRKRKESLLANPERARRKQLAEYKHATVGELERLSAGGDREAYFATLFRLLQEQLGHTLKVPASGITEAIVAERLPELQPPTHLMDRLENLFHLCNAARYGGSAEVDLQKVTAEAHTAIRELESLEHSPR